MVSFAIKTILIPSRQAKIAMKGALYGFVCTVTNQLSFFKKVVKQKFEMCLETVKVFFEIVQTILSSVVVKVKVCAKIIYSRQN